MIFWETLTEKFPKSQMNIMSTRNIKQTTGSHIRIKLVHSIEEETHLQRSQQEKTQYKQKMKIKTMLDCSSEAVRRQWNNIFKGLGGSSRPGVHASSPRNVFQKWKRKMTSTDQPTNAKRIHHQQTHVVRNVEGVHWPQMEIWIYTKAPRTTEKVSMWENTQALSYYFSLFRNWG